jgi:hypothetical protein
MIISYAYKKRKNKRSNIMKKLIMLIAIMSFGMASFAQTISKSFPVSNFNGIIAGSVFDVELIKSPSESVVVTADKEVMQYIEVKVVRGMLTFAIDTYKMPNKFKRNMDFIKVKVLMKEELNWLSLSGASRLSTKSTFSPKSFKAQISGASKVIGLNIISDTGEVVLSGASSMDIFGKFSEGIYEISGASSAVVNQDIAKFSVETSGASKLNFNGKCDLVEMECSGASYTKFNGECESMSTEVSGASKFDGIDFKVNSLTIEANGVSSANIYVEKSLDVEISGGSSVRYKGSPTIKKTDVRSSSSLKKID